MKSIFTVSFFVALLFSAGTAFSYQCDIPAPPQVQPCPCSLCQQKQYRQDYRSGEYTTCKKCNKCNRHNTYNCRKCNKCAKCAAQKKPCRKHVVYKDSYQCKTTYTTKTEQTNTVQCRFCGTQYPKGVDHYCNRIQCRSCGQIPPRGVDHRCGMRQYRTCDTPYQQNKQYHCDKIRCQSCGAYYDPRIGHHCRTRHQYHDCSQGKQCSTQGCSVTRKEVPRQEARATRWHTWFKNQS